MQSLHSLDEKTIELTHEYSGKIRLYFQALRQFYFLLIAIGPLFVDNPGHDDVEVNV
jgi:hypothetical protein